MVTKGYGFTVNDIDQSCPTDLEPYEKAHKKELVEQDNLQYLWWGKYGLSSLGVAIEHCLAGKKAKSKYVDKTIFSEINNAKYGCEGNGEEIAIFEMKQRIQLLRTQGLPESPI